MSICIFTTDHPGGDTVAIDFDVQDNCKIESTEEPIFAYVSASGIVTPAKVAHTPATARKASTLGKSRYDPVLCFPFVCFFSGINVRLMTLSTMITVYMFA